MVDLWDRACRRLQRWNKVRHRQHRLRCDILVVLSCRIHVLCGTRNMANNGCPVGDDVSVYLHRRERACSHRFRANFPGVDRATLEADESTIEYSSALAP